MASNAGSLSKRSRLLAWFDRRVPIQAFLDSQLTGYYAPKNLNIWYYFGALALLVLVMQFATGIFLAMSYKPGEVTAFDSVEYIMREGALGLAYPLRAFDGSVLLLRRGVSTHVQGAALRVVQGAA